MGKKNQSSPNQARGEGGFMDRWEIRGIDLVNYGHACELEMQDAFILHDPCITISTSLEVKT